MGCLGVSLPRWYTHRPSNTRRVAAQRHRPLHLLGSPAYLLRNTLMESCAFLAQCALIFELQPSSFPSDHTKISYLITLISERDLTWATAI